MTSPIYCLSLLAVICVACGSPYVRPDEPRIANLTISSDWDEIPKPDDVSRKGWEVRMFKENDGFTINRVKVEDGNEFSLNGVKLASKAYCVVNEDGSEESTVMGQGYLVLTGSNAFYIQHSSRKPVAHWTARSVVESLLETAVKAKDRK